MAVLATTSPYESISNATSCIRGGMHSPLCIKLAGRKLGLNRAGICDLDTSIVNIMKLVGNKVSQELSSSEDVDELILKQKVVDLTRALLSSYKDMQGVNKSTIVYLKVFNKLLGSLCDMDNVSFDASVTSTDSGQNLWRNLASLAQNNIYGRSAVHSLIQRHLDSGQVEVTETLLKMSGSNSMISISESIHHMTKVIDEDGIYQPRIKFSEKERQALTEVRDSLLKSIVISRLINPIGVVDECSCLDMNLALELIEQELDQMPPNKMLYIPGGWFRDGANGHSIGYCIKKEEDETLTFKVINTGFGVDSYHKSSEGRFFDLEYRNLSIEDLFAVKKGEEEPVLKSLLMQLDGKGSLQDTYSALQKLEKYPTIRKKEDIVKWIQYIQKYIFSHIFDTKEHHAADTSRKIQNLGTCVDKSLRGYTKYHLCSLLGKEKGALLHRKLKICEQYMVEQSLRSIYEKTPHASGIIIKKVSREPNGITILKKSTFDAVNSYGSKIGISLSRWQIQELLSLSSTVRVKRSVKYIKEVSLLTERIYLKGKLREIYH